MKIVRGAAIAAAMLFAASCGMAPEKSIAKDCERLDMLSQVPGAGDEKKSCKCFGDKLKSDMSKENLAKLAKVMKKAKSESDFESAAQSEGLSESAGMAMMGAAKSCAMGS